MSLVELQGIGKNFGPLAALSGVDFSAEGGTIQALVGENGAGKTTLMKVLHGEHSPDAGKVILRGKEVRLRSPKEARSQGIGMVSQHYAIIPELTTLQNLMLGDEPGELLSLGSAEARAEELAQKMGFRFDWRALAASLSPGDAQKLEILKLLWRKSEIMILDEPTAMLSPKDSDSLYDSLEELAKQGACIIVVTHRVKEVLERCSRVTVLRGGLMKGSHPVADLTEESLSELIIGKGLVMGAKGEASPGELLVDLQGATVLGERRDAALKEASLTVRQGEVVGIAGVDGSGQKELFDALLGTRPLAGGSLQLGGKPAPPRVAERLALGLRLIPEDRLSQAASAEKSLEWNAMLGLQRSGLMNRGPWIDLPARKSFAQKALARFSARHTSSTQPLSDLSGGNQQRFVAGRALGHQPRILLAFQPTRGLDIQGNEDIYGEIRRVCREEKAGALVVSFDLDELLAQADRIVVMFEGKIKEPPAHLARDRAAIGRMMVGAEP